MNEERRLIALGYPADEALCICYSMRREGTLYEFVAQAEREYQERVKERDQTINQQNNELCEL